MASKTAFESLVAFMLIGARESGCTLGGPAISFGSSEDAPVGVAFSVSPLFGVDQVHRGFHFLLRPRRWTDRSSALCGIPPAPAPDCLALGNGGPDRRAIGRPQSALAQLSVCIRCCLARLAAPCCNSRERYRNPSAIPLCACIVFLAGLGAPVRSTAVTIKANPHKFRRFIRAPHQCICHQVSLAPAQNPNKVRACF